MPDTEAWNLTTFFSGMPLMVLMPMGQLPSTANPLQMLFQKDNVLQQHTLYSSFQWDSFPQQHTTYRCYSSGTASFNSTPLTALIPVGQLPSTAHPLQLLFQLDSFL